MLRILKMIVCGSVRTECRCCARPLKFYVRARAGAISSPTCDTCAGPDAEGLVVQAGKLNIFHEVEGELVRMNP